MTSVTKVNAVALLLALTSTFSLQAEETPAVQAVPSSHPQLRYHPEGEGSSVRTAAANSIGRYAVTRRFRLFISATGRDGAAWITTEFSAILISLYNVATMQCGCMISKKSPRDICRDGCSGF
ncbi:MAG: hypothetical protein WCK17_15935 [Verrucomicrobiota bacterium]